MHHPRRTPRALAGAGALLVVVAAGCTPTGDDARSGPPSSLPSTSAEEDADADASEAQSPSRPPEGVTTSAPGLPPADRTLPDVTLTPIATLDAPIGTTVLPDGTVLVAERGGTVRELIGADGTVAADGEGRVVVDVRGRTTTDGERGLLAIAVAPDGDELVLSMTDEDGDTLIEAHPLVDGIVEGAPRILYTLPQPFANHNGGAILFTPDGLLLVGLGDGGGAGDPLGAGQDRTTPLGSVLRLDVTGPTTRAAAGNPFLGDADAAPEIVATGLRNPWRMALDRPRGELWIADVGQSEREEINRIALDDLPGANFGWALREGGVEHLGAEPDDHVPPIHDYAHGPGCSVTGGSVYRGAALPELTGAYVFSDWCDGQLRALLDDRGSVVARPLGAEGEQVVGLGVDADGELLVLELSGRVLRLERL